MSATHQYDAASIPPAAALTLFFRIADAWRLSVDDQRALTGFPSRTTLYDWRHTPPRSLSYDLVLRISYLVGIYGLLHRIFHYDPAAADEYVSQPGSGPFEDGRSALAVMRDGGILGLHAVRMYLESVAGGHEAASGADAWQPIRATA